MSTYNNSMAAHAIWEALGMPDRWACPDWRPLALRVERLAAGRGDGLRAEVPDWRRHRQHQRAQDRRRLHLRQGDVGAMGRAGSVETPGVGGRKPLLKRLEGPSTLALGLVAALLIVVVVRRPWDDIGGFRVKDKARVGFFLMHGGTTSAGSGGRRGAARRRRAVRLQLAGAFVPGDPRRRRGRPYPGPVPRRRASGARARRPRCRAAPAYRARRHHRPRARGGAVLRASDRHRARPPGLAGELGGRRTADPPGCYADITGWEKRAP